MVPVEAITKERLDLWAARLKEAHATPILLMAVGHDYNLGRRVLCTLEEQDMPTAHLIVFLRAALFELEQ